MEIRYVVLCLDVKTIQSCSTWNHNYDKSTELQGWHCFKKVSAVFHCVVWFNG